MKLQSALKGLSVKVALCAKGCREGRGHQQTGASFTATWLVKFCIYSLGKGQGSCRAAGWTGAGSVFIGRRARVAERWPLTP